MNKYIENKEITDNLEKLVKDLKKITDERKNANTVLKGKEIIKYKNFITKLFELIRKIIEELEKDSWFNNPGTLELLSNKCGNVERRFDYLYNNVSISEFNRMNSVLKPDKKIELHFDPENGHYDIDNDNDYLQKFLSQYIVADIDSIIGVVYCLIELYESRYNVELMPTTEIQVSSPIFSPTVYTEKKTWIQKIWDMFDIIKKSLSNFWENKTRIINVPYEEIYDDRTKDDHFRRSVRLTRDIINRPHLQETTLDGNNLYDEVDKKVSTGDDTHKKLYKKFSDLSSTHTKAYKGTINETEYVVVNDKQNSNGSMTLIRIDNRYFGVKVTDGKIEYIEEIPNVNENSNNIFDCELYITSNNDDKSNTIVYDENREGFRKNTYSVHENEDGTFLIEIKGKYEPEGTHSCELLYQSKNDFLNKKSPIEITFYDFSNKTIIEKTENEEYDVFFSEKLYEKESLGWEWKNGSIVYSGKLEYILRNYWNKFIVLTNSGINPATLTVDEFSRILVNAVENGLQVIPKEVVDIMCYIHPEYKKIINNNSNEKIINYHDEI